MARRSDWEGDAAAGIVGLCVMIIVLTAIVAIKLLVATTKEVGRIYAENLSDARTSRILWYALGGLFGLWFVCSVVASIAHTMVGPCVYAAAWGFLVYVISIEIVDWRARGRYGLHGKASDLESYLSGLGKSESKQTAGMDAQSDEAAGSPPEKHIQEPKHEGETMTEVLVTVDEAARRLSLGRTLLYELIGEGKIRSIKIGRARRIPVTAIDEWVMDRVIEELNTSDKPDGS